MNIRKSIILSLTVAAFAAPGISSAMSSYTTNGASQNTNTRAEVIHTLEVARKDGTLMNNVSRESSSPLPSLDSVNTRAQVLRELQAARLNGSLTNNVEKNYGIAQKFTKSEDTRMQVKRELAVARADGQVQDNISRN